MDLEDFRAAVAELSAQIVAPSLKEIGLLQTVEAMPELGKSSNAIRKSKSQADVEKNLLASTTAFLISLNITPHSQLAAQATQIEQELQNRRAKSFPLDLFARSAFTAWDRNSTALAMFIARAVQENTGFIIMDDPVLTSDDDFRPNFERSVINGLLDNGIQVIVLTQDYQHWKDIGELWRHRNAKQLQISRNDPTKGSEVLSSDDDLATMITRARTYIKSQDAEQRKEGAGKIRDAIERFAKEIIVKNRRASGDNMAAITEYDGKPFDNYRQKAIDLLVLDPSHPGKLRTAYSNVTPGSHDDKPPSATQLSTALGDLAGLKKAYL